MAIEIEGVARKSMVMFFLIDTSGSMEGRSIAAVNDAMREVIPDIQDISDNNADASIKLAVMSFSSGTNWETPQPVELDSYRWSDLDAGGTTDMGEAFSELNSKLDRNAFLQDPAGVKAPVIIMLAESNSTADWMANSAPLSLKNGRTPRSCRMHLPPSSTASSSRLISSWPSF